jgi:hypothetical protein
LKPEVREEILRKTDGALKDLEPLSQEISKLNLKINTTLLALAQVDGRNPTEVALENKQRIDNLENDIRSRETFLMQVQDRNLIAQCSSEFSVLKKNLSQLHLIQDEVMASSRGVDQCREFSGISREMNSLRLRMTQYRQQLFNTIPLVMQGLDQASAADTVSKRKLDNCSKDKVNRYSQRISSANCKCSPPLTSQSDTCQDLCESQAMAQEIFNTCERAVKLTASVRPEAQDSQWEKVLNENMKSLEGLHNELAQDFCRGSECAKDDKSFSSFSDNVSTKIAEVEKLCRKKNAGNTVSIQERVSGQQKGDLALAGSLPVADMRPKDLPKTSGEAPGFFSRLFAGLKSLFFGA